MNNITVRLSPNIEFELGEIAKELGVTKSSIIRAALIHLIEEYNAKKKTWSNEK